jgi:hypothetical protein
VALEGIRKGHLSADACGIITVGAYRLFAINTISKFSVKIQRIFNDSQSHHEFAIISDDGIFHGEKSPSTIAIVVVVVVVVGTRLKISSKHLKSKVYSEMSLH